ncbi:hypothetical protein GCM10023093_17370 [Nemorincola caseinilytica]|uniref:Uncharacterized protein n=1 Tax=Nemorincola caseinilytica TaxID=2054315 RepID=A0ABP8NF70_9BACT
MKKMIAAAMLMAMAVTTHAQDNDDRDAVHMPTTTERNFAMLSGYVNIRDYAYLPNKAFVKFELNNVAQYEEIKNGLDTIVAALLHDIAFYKDSLKSDGGNVWIDYAIDEKLGVKKLRFKKYPPDGDIFVNKKGDVAKLKIEQDTVRILVRHYPLVPALPDNARRREKNYQRLEHYQVYQVTFCVNSYEDVARITADKQSLWHAIDTLVATKKEGTVNRPYKFPSSSRYNPYATSTVKDKYLASFADVRFKRYPGLVTTDDGRAWNALKRADEFTMNANFGIGLMRNVLAPYAELGFELSRSNGRMFNNKYQRFRYRVYGSCYFAFEHNAADNSYKTLPNWFVNADLGDNNDLFAGVGYMVKGNGGYFTGTTVKAFMNVRLLKKGLTLSPELIFTNDFKQVFPGLTLKVF